MNTQPALGGLLLASLLCALPAQDLHLTAAAHPDRILADVTGANEGDLVVLVLGLSPAAIKLPGEHLLGVQPDLVTGFVVAAGRQAVDFAVRLPALERDLDCLVQAVAVTPRLPLDDGKAIRVSDVTRLSIAADPPGRR